MASDPIAILGWGSLIWDLDNLESKIVGDWRMRAGPRLPIEFSRVSKKRRGGLTLVVDVEHGAQCMTHVVVHRGGDVLAARADLAARERAAERHIGWADARGGIWSEADPAAALVRDWLRGSGFGGAVWTALPGNFAEEAGQAFSLEAAEAHLQTLTGEDQAEAVRYIHFAPEETDTRLRRHLAGRDWWLDAVTRVIP